MKALVIEDSRLAREGLCRMLERFPELDVVGQAKTAVQARELIDKHQPDVLFLDIHMPGESGLELLQSLTSTPKIIFTTAYAEYAINSFDYPTVDFLLKPISHERLAKSIEKLSAEESPSAQHLPERVLKENSKIFIKDNDECHLISLSDIVYIESCKNYVCAFFNGKKAFIRKNMAALEQTLPRAIFFRASRQFIVNLNRIDQIKPGVSEGYDLVMEDGKRVEVSRRNAAELKDRLSI
ncbi:LytTR family DNA-binding domain-containing protein [Cellvibrio sp. pealriver]|uniref:LytR/AlgR family response regulator transcription factor n=1 Tax=Cellvibrio sp. pealriver TaxID=1622269 RepID=UPI00066FE406|nr:LytTR family transcriptional regulator DNA-binding domain-containing protein [Cellvibrio sp. pealriver]